MLRLFWSTPIPPPSRYLSFTISVFVRASVCVRECEWVCVCARARARITGINPLLYNKCRHGRTEMCRPRLVCCPLWQQLSKLSAFRSFELIRTDHLGYLHPWPSSVSAVVVAAAAVAAALAVAATTLAKHPSSRYSTRLWHFNTHKRRH